ncbi:MAG TPA: EthD family reductase, partial [Gemmatimonadales bacterium]|nr:EthD family reductase [Gemmatimonadales bacterium]
MPRHSRCRWLCFPVLTIAAACSPDERAAGRSGTGRSAADTTTAAAPADTAPALLTVLYHQPKDTAEFERYYRTTHLPLVVANQKEIGFTRADLTKFIRTVDG